MVNYEQGDIIKVEGIRNPLIVVSKDLFNKEGMAMCCPLFEKTTSHPLHISVSGIDGQSYIATVEQTKLVDISARGYSVISRISYYDVMNVSDALQALFEY